MNICPECKSFIHHLIVRKMEGKVYIMEEDKTELQPNMVEDDDGFPVLEDKIAIVHYSCPNCEYIIYEDGEDAQEWLNGK